MNTDMGMLRILSPSAAVLLLLCFGSAMLAITTWVTWGRKRDKVEFLLSSRQVGVWPGAFSIAASWIWAPALFVASQKAYDQGVPGVFWFVFPNFLALVVFAPLGAKIRSVLPDGYTLPQFIKMRHGRAVHVLYLIQFIGLQLCSFAVQVLAGATLIHIASGLSYIYVAVTLAGIVLTYSLLGGLRGSIATDRVQMIAILVVALTSVPWSIIRAGGVKVVLAGLGGASGNYFNVFDPWVAYSFGISVTIGLLSGPIGDQMHWQRAFAMRSQGDVFKTFILAAFVFAVVPLTLANLGFLAANHSVSANWQIPSSQMIGPTTIANLLPPFMLILFIIMLLSGLCSTLDSILSAVSSMYVVDLVSSMSGNDSRDDHNVSKVRVARASMFLTAICGLGIALIPHLQIVHLFLFYGTWRASTLIPTVLTLYWRGLKSHAVFFSVLGSLVFGAPVLAIGTYVNNPHMSVAGSMLVVVISLIACVGLSKLSEREKGASAQAREDSFRSDSQAKT